MSIDRLPDVVPPVRRPQSLNRGLPAGTAKEWLAAGWNDFRNTNMEASLLYGIAVFVISAIIVTGLFLLRADYALFPALAAFMVFGPAMAVGLYEKSRRIQNGEPVTIGNMMNVQVRSRGQILFIGVLLFLLVLLWVRLAVLLYAMFFGMHAFPGLGQILPLLIGSFDGIMLLLVGSLAGALFAALAFAISAFSIPMLLDENTDAFSAMGASMALVWHNLPVMLVWGAIVIAIFIACAFTGLLGLIVAFPVLGHATWHAYRAIRGVPHSPVLTPAISDPANP